MSYSVRRFRREEDSEKLFVLWGKVLKKPERERLDALYNDSLNGASTWMIYCEDGMDPVGSMSVLPLKISLKQEAAMLGINCDMMITKEHRTLGPAVMLARSLVRGTRELGYDVLLAMPNEMSKPVFKRVGYKKVGDALRFSRILRSRNKVAQIFKNNYVVWVISHLVDVFFRFITLNGCMRLYFRKKRNQVHEVDISMNGTDALETLCKEGIQKETANLLYWRYGKVSKNGSRIYIQRYTKDNSLNYIIYYEQGKHAIIEKVDSLKGATGLLLLSRFIDNMYEQGIETIQSLYWGPKRYHGVFNYLGFIGKQGREVFMFSLNNLSEPLLAELERSQWFDGDLDL
jgi:hypothetical protein